MKTQGIKYRLVKGNSHGELQEDVTFRTSIVGYSAEMRGFHTQCRLHMDGRLVIGRRFRWDFGSWAIDGPAMVMASLKHDALCMITNRRLVPWSVRAEADAEFRADLKRYGKRHNALWRAVNFIGRWRRWAGVSLYSQLVARWRDKKTDEGEDQ